VTAAIPKVTAVLLNWRRPDNIPLILERLAEQPFVDEIVLWNNDDSICEHKDHSDWFWATGDVRLRLLFRFANLGTWARFLACREASCDWIITQDDDCLCDNWPELYREALAHPDAITANMHRNEDDTHDGLIYVDGKCWDVWLGWGSMFRRELIGDIFERYVAKWGEDECLLRDADRVFAVALGRRHHAIQARTENLPGIDGPMAIHKDGRKHLTWLARRRGVQLAEKCEREGR